MNSAAMPTLNQGEAFSVPKLPGIPGIETFTGHTFHTSRWDYAYTIRRDGKTAEQRHLSVFFKEGRYERNEGDVMPSESEFTTSLALSIKKDVDKKTKLPVMTATPEQLSKVQPPALKTPLPAGLAQAEPKTYPPLDAPASWKEPK